MASLVILATTFAVLPSCNVFRSTDTCASDADCGRGTSCTDGACALTSPVRVGAVLSLTGNLKLRAQGQNCRDALLFVRDLANAPDAKPGGRGFDLVLADDESDAVTAGVRARERGAPNVFLEVGGITSAQALAVEKETGPTRTTQISPFAGASQVADAQGELSTRFLFSLSPTIANGSPLALVKYLGDLNAGASPPVCKRTVVLHNDDVTGADFHCTFARLFRLNTMCVKDHVPVSTSLKDSYEAEVSRLVADAPDCVILAVNPDVAGAVFEAVERRFPPPQKAPWVWMGNSQTHTPELLPTTLVSGAGSRSRAEGFFGADIDFTPQRLAYGQMLDLYNAYLAQQGREPLVELPARFSACADLGMLIGLTIEKAGPNPSPEAIRDAFIDVATFSEGDTTVTPAQFADALRLVRRGVAIDYKGAASDDELSDEGMMKSAPLNVWAVKNGAFDETVRKYDDGQTLDVLTPKSQLPSCELPPECAP